MTQRTEIRFCQVASLSFINAIVCGGPGRELDFRVHIRSEFTKLGVDNILERLSNAEHDLLDTQINVYQERADADERDLADKYEVKRVNMDDADGMFTALHSALKNTRSYPALLDILKHALLIPANPIKRYVNIKGLIARSAVILSERSTFKGANIGRSSAN
jgi:hypothetical protein